MAELQPTLGQQAAEAGDANVKDNIDRCLYIRIPWDNDVIANHRDIDDFMEASPTIGRTLAVRTCTLILQLLSFFQSVL
jgi:hypothetical protein